MILFLHNFIAQKNPKNLTEVLEITMLYLYNNLDKELQKKRGKMDE